VAEILFLCDYIPKEDVSFAVWACHDYVLHAAD
jgi:hypothetical protein